MNRRQRPEERNPMADITSLGELLVDMTPLSPISYQYNPGGGPANMICMVRKLSVPAAFIGQVGNDAFGKKLQAKLVSEKVDTEALSLSDQYPTTLAFVHWAEHGERSFSFYRHGSADTKIEVTDIAKEKIRASKIFFLSSVLMSEGTSRDTSFELMKFAKDQGITIAFDPNVRLNLWSSQEECVSYIRKALVYPDIVKVSEEELAMITDKETVDEGIKVMYRAYPQIKVLLVTLGSKGAVAALPDGSSRHFEGYQVEAVDTTGAGDAFTGAFLAEVVLHDTDINSVTLDQLEPLIKVANAAGALTTTGKGGIDAQPSAKQIEELIKG